MKDDAQMQQLANAVAKLASDKRVEGGSEKMQQEVLSQVLTRIVHVLTREDMEKAQEIANTDPSGDAITYFLMTKVPNLEAIIQEEIDAYNKGMGSLPNRGGDTT